LGTIMFLARVPHHSQTTLGWVLLTPGPVNRQIILAIQPTHCSTFQLTIQTRYEVWPHAQGKLCCLTVITSRPLRLPYARNLYLAGFHPNFDRRLPQLEHSRDAGISGPTSVIFRRMPMAIPRVLCRCICPLLPCRLWPSPLMQRIGVYSDYLGFIPHPDSPSYIHPGATHEAAPFALCYGLRLWPAPLTG